MQLLYVLWYIILMQEGQNWARGIPEISDEEFELCGIDWSERPRANEAAQQLQTFAKKFDQLVDPVFFDENHVLIEITPGESLIIERYLSTGAWLDTRIYVVIDYNPDNGDIKLWDNEYEQYSWSNVIAGTLRGVARYFSPR